MIIAAVSLEQIFTPENLTSLPALLLYLVLVLGVACWLVLLFSVRGASRRLREDVAGALRSSERKLAEVSDLVNGLHDAFSGLGDEFKFFKENVMVKLNSNARTLESLPQLAEQVGRLESAPPPSPGEEALGKEAASLRERLAEKDERIAGLEREVENFHRILEGKTLEEASEAGGGEGLEGVRKEQEALEAQRQAFESHQEKVKADIQAASDRLRSVQEETRAAREALEAERRALDEERQALEQEKAELAELGGLPPSSGSAGGAALQRLREEKEALERELARLRAAAGEADGPEPAAGEAAAEAEGPAEEPAPLWGGMLASQADEGAEEGPPGAAAAEPAAREAGEEAAPVEPSPDAAGAAGEEESGGEPSAPREAEPPAPEEPAEPEALAGEPVPCESRGLDVVRRDGILVVRILFEDMKRPEAQDLIDLVFGQTEEKSDRVLLDFTPTSYINSSGMSALTKVAVERDCQIVLVNPDILKVIDLMGFLPLLNINETFEEALEAFGDEED